jgi:GH24 family phage-related lysozyme (muramidase)
MAMTPSQKCIDLVKSSEGCKLTAYQDSVGVWTIGYGVTTIDGKPVTKGKKIKQADADALLMVELTKAAEQLLAVVKVALNQNQFDALVDFVYNLGIGSLRKSHLLVYLNAKNYVAAAGEFKKWCNAGGKPLPGLVTRRNAEAELFMS